MIFQKKTLRYYWWVGIEFFKKHLKLISISFLISFIFLIGVVSISPYLETVIPQKKEIIGLVGNYDFNNLPEEIVSKISNGLLYINEKGEIIPLLSSSWEVRNNGREYRFHLKNGLLWNDGKKFAAADINYQFKDIVSKVINENTIDFYLNKPLGIFPTYLRKPLIRYPAIGIAGLYKVAGIKTQYGYITSLTLTPNKKNLPLVTYKFFNNEGAMIAAYKKGEVTMIKTTKKSVADTFTHWKNTKITKTIDYSRLLTLFYNGDNPLLRLKDIKQAILMAIDFNQFVSAGEMAKGPIASVSWAYNPNLKNPIYDPEAAEKIIQKTLSSTTSAKLNLVTYYDYYDIADRLVGELERAGLKVNLNIISYDKPSSFDFLLAFWKVPPDPDQYYFWHSTQTQGNIGNYKNVKVDKLLEDGRATLSLDERKKIYFELQRVMQDDPPALFLYYPTIYTIERK